MISTQYIYNIYRLPGVCRDGPKSPLVAAPHRPVPLDQHDGPGRGHHQAQLQGLQVTQAALVMLRSVQFATFKEYFEST